MILPLAFTLLSCTKKPEACYSVTGAQMTGQEVEFFSCSQDVNTLSWDFGDGSTSLLSNPVHVFNRSGSYTVTLTATNGSKEAVYTKSIEIEPNLLEVIDGLWELPLYNIDTYINGSLESTITDNCAGCSFAFDYYTNECTVNSKGEDPQTLELEYTDESSFKIDGFYYKILEKTDRRLFIQTSETINNGNSIG